MLVNTHYTVTNDLLQRAVNQLPKFERRIDLTVPTGNFFYDKWKISEEFKNSIWSEILDTLPVEFGQARIMRLTPGEAYYSHADMDDRYHLNLIGNRSYLIDLDNDRMYPTVPDGIWYLMDAGIRHSAVNFSNKDRIQLVVRKLLSRGNILDPVLVCITLVEHRYDFRYVFDDVFSQWLNRKDKAGEIDRFEIVNDRQVKFVINRKLVNELEQMCPEKFKIEI